MLKKAGYLTFLFLFLAFVDSLTGIEGLVLGSSCSEVI